MTKGYMTFALFALIIKGYRRDVFITERLVRKEEIALSTVKHVLFKKKYSDLGSFSEIFDQGTYL